MFQILFTNNCILYVVSYDDLEEISLEMIFPKVLSEYLSLHNKPI